LRSVLAAIIMTQPVPYFGAYLMVFICFTAQPKMCSFFWDVFRTAEFILLLSESSVDLISSFVFFAIVFSMKLIVGYQAIRNFQVLPLMKKEDLRLERSEYCWKRTHSTVNKFPDLSNNKQLHAFVVVWEAFEPCHALCARNVTSLEDLHFRVSEALKDEYIHLAAFHRGVYHRFVTDDNPSVLRFKESFWNRDENAMWYQFIYFRSATPICKYSSLICFIREVFGSGLEWKRKKKVEIVVAGAPQKKEEEEQKRTLTRSVDDSETQKGLTYKKRMMNYQSFLTDSRCVY